LGDLDPIANISTQSKVHLQTLGHFDAILGIEMGPGTIDGTTLLAKLNGDVGAGIASGIAFTGSDDVQRVFGRLSADASFDVGIVTGITPMARVTVPKSSTDANTALNQLRDNINLALTTAAPFAPPLPVGDLKPLGYATNQLSAPGGTPIDAPSAPTILG